MYISCIRPGCEGRLTHQGGAGKNGNQLWTQYVACPKCDTEHRCVQYEDGSWHAAALEPHEYMTEI